MQTPTLAAAAAFAALATGSPALAQSQPRADFFFTADNGRASAGTTDSLLQGTGGLTLVDLGSGSPADVDEVNGSLVFTDFSQDKFFSVSTSGGTPTEIFDAGAAFTGAGTTIFSFAADASGDTLYFGESSTGTVYSLTGGAASPLVNFNSTFGTDRANLRGIALDESGGKIYFTEVGTDGVYRADLSGGNPELVLDVGLLGGTSPNAITLDAEAGRLYVVDNSDLIVASDLDGSDAAVFSLDAAAAAVGQTSFTPNDVELFGGRLYVADSSAGVFSLATDGTDYRVEFGDDFNVRGVAVVPEPATAAVLALGGLAVLGRRRSR